LVIDKFCFNLEKSLNSKAYSIVTIYKQSNPTSSACC